MTFLNQVQGSPEWLVERKKRIGGSEIAAILGISPWMTPFQLWEIKTGLKEQEDISNKPHVVRGILAEPIARDKFSKKYGKLFVPTVWPVIEGCLGASDDGYCAETNEIIEIKAMGEQAHENVKSGDIPEYYYCQMLWTMGVSGATRCHFISVRPESNYELATIVVDFDKRSFEAIKEKALAFWKLVETKTPPELLEKDVIDLSGDASFKETATLYVNLVKQLKELEVRAEEAKALLISKMQGAAAVKGCGIRLTRYTSKGAIEYAKVRELEGVDLEPYRKPPKISFRVTLS